MNIMKTLQHYKEHAENQGLHVYAIGLKGSQNYNLDDDESDIDANLVFIPTLQQLRKSETFKFTFNEGEVTCHNIYDFAHIVAKGNPQFIEVCNTEFAIGDFSLFKQYNLNPSALKGMFMEKVHAFSKLYPSRRSIVEKYGYDCKQLHHLIRLYDVLLKGTNTYTYTEEEKSYMMDIKRGRLPGSLKLAENLRDEYVKKLQVIYEERKLAYTPQTIDYEALDAIVLDYYSTLRKGD